MRIPKGGRRSAPSRRRTRRWQPRCWRATAQPSPENYRTVAEQYRRVRVYDKAQEYLTRALKLDRERQHDARRAGAHVA